MFRNIITLLILIFISNNIKSQNLLINQSFEDSDCPIYISETPYNWIQCRPDFDLISTCDTSETLVDYYSVGVPSNWFGYQYPKNGNNYISILISSLDGDRREWARGFLVDELLKDEFYLIILWVSRCDNFCVSSNNIGVSFQDISSQYSNFADFSNIDYSYVLNNTNSIIDTSNWTKIELLYFAKGTERTMTIGNFFRNEDTKIEKLYDCEDEYYSKNAYYYIDDISIQHVDITSINEYNLPNSNIPTYYINQIGQKSEKMFSGFNIIVKDKKYYKVFLLN